MILSMSKIKSKTFFILSLFALFIQCKPSNEQSLESYTPIKEFQPAYYAFSNALSQSSNAKDYDLDEIMKVLNGMERAQNECSDFHSFLEYLAKLDYSKIPDDVIEVKMALLPILQDLFLVKKDSTELSNNWEMVTKCLVSGVKTSIENTDTKAMLCSLVGNGGEPMSTAISAFANTMANATNEAYNQYLQVQKDREINEGEFCKIKDRYLEYLYDYYPIYIKYYKEWDKLCVDKDQAYIQLYSKRPVDCYNTTASILDKFPKNRDAMLLHAAAAIGIASSQQNNIGDLQSKTLPDQQNAVNTNSLGFYEEAETMLDDYITEYPTESAPALLIKGLSSISQGSNEKAMNFFEQAAIEYPRQAEALKSMMNSYLTRNYLNNSIEGLTLLRYYNSTSEGYGYFSPNFQKAIYYQSIGDIESASKEIYNHFFRREHQGLYDCLLSDMEFCEDNLYPCLKAALMETALMDITVNEKTNLLSNDALEIIFTNNSDIDLRNVRLFVCYHLNDMYINDYIVEPCHTVSTISQGSSQTWEKVIDKDNPESFGGADIVKIRAIMMTDDKVAWIDDLNYRRSELSKELNKILPSGPDSKTQNLLGSFALSPESLRDKIKEETSVAFDSQGSRIKNLLGQSKTIMTINIPRSICLVDPVFSLGEPSDGVFPISQGIHGSKVVVSFDCTSLDKIPPLYICGHGVNMCLNIDKSGNTATITEAKVL